MVLKYLLSAREQERGFSMLPDNFNFALMPDIPHTGSARLQDIGMVSSTIENIDYAITAWVKEDLQLQTLTNEGRVRVPVLWQAPERAYQIKHKKSFITKSLNTIIRQHCDIALPNCLSLTLFYLHV